MFQFSTATIENAGELTDLVNSVYRGESGARSWTGEAHLLDGQRVDVERVSELLTSQDDVIIVAKRENSPAIVSCVHLRKEANFAYLGMLTVDVSEQRSGLGSALLNEAERFTQQNFGLNEIRMTVISVRNELIEWYERRGYALTGEKMPFPYGQPRFGIPKRNDLEFVVLHKKISRQT